MTTQEYSLRWNNHQPNFISMFTQFLDTKILTDCTLVVEGQRLTAHRVILSACSTFFHSIFIDVHNQAYHPIIVLNNVTYEDLKTVLQFMYYGAVNVTAEQLPRVIETGKLLKVKGLTEMTETSPSVSQPVTTQDEPSPRRDHSQLSVPTPPPTEMSNSLPKRRRIRKSSNSSTNFNIELAEDSQAQGTGPTDVLNEERITLSDVTLNTPQDENVNRAYTLSTPQALHQQGSDSLSMETQTPIESDMVGIRMRRNKVFRRQERVAPDDREITKQVSEPGPATASRNIQRHESYPQYVPKSRHQGSGESEDKGHTLVRAVTVVGHRASHTPAVRSGPPLSCNFCWNTVDDSGRILRRKTQYHCPECRTNLCIVPCFHEYHEGTEVDDAVNAR